MNGWNVFIYLWIQTKQIKKIVHADNISFIISTNLSVESENKL